MRNRIGLSYNQKKVKDLSYKLSSAVDILKYEYGNVTAIRTYINQNSDLNLTDSEFSKLIGAHKKKEYIASTLQRKFQKIFEILDPFLKDSYNFFWDETEKQYREEPADPRDPRLQGLKGVWEGYSWDQTTTEDTTVEHIHVFKVHILNVNNILCKTKGANFKGKKIRMITDDRITMEVSNTHRKVFLIVYIGNASLEDLQKTKRFYLAYTDSGKTRVKAGLAILERADNFDEIVAESRPLSSFEGEKDASFFSFLKNTQLIID